MATRRRAREIVLQLLYEDDLNPEQDHEVAQKFLSTRLHANTPLVSFAKALWRNVIKNREAIDKALSAKATNWSLRRMAAIDRNILRLGAYEILMTDTPGVVVINEAVELAKRYGDRQSGQFVNGILDRILNQSDVESDTAGDAQSVGGTENAVSSEGEIGNNERLTSDSSQAATSAASE